MEAPPRLDLDLMTDMHDMIYRKPSPIGQHAPPVNREVGLLRANHKHAYFPGGSPVIVIYSFIAN